MPHKRLRCTFPDSDLHPWQATDGGSVQLDLLAALGRGLAGRYTVTRELGRGGMAVVYECQDLGADRDVAIKLLYPDLARALGGERFLREIQILQQLSHPNILPLLASGTIELLPGLDLPWYAMPLAREETLRARLTREGALPLPIALGYVRDLCSALAHAHGQGIIHRDIKPENILLVDGHAVLADFGIARAVTVAGGETLSTTGIVVGTPAYMSPEQSVGAKQLDGRSDLYSLGVVLYEMLAGHPPFSGSTPQAVSARHQFEVPPPIEVVRPDLPDALVVMLNKALTKVAADRYQQASDLAVALEGVSLKAGTRTVKRAPAQARRRITVVTVVALALGFAGWRFLDAEVSDAPLAVLPFTASGVPTSALCGTECATLVDDALGQWVDFPKLDQLRVRNVVAELGTPQVLDDAERIARAAGAGRFIWGEVFQVGDELRVRVSLNQLTRMGSKAVTERSVSLPLRIAGQSDSAEAVRVAVAFTDMARALVSPPGPIAPVEESLRTTSLAAMRLKLAGDSALAAWDLQVAKERYRGALTIDHGYPQALLALATVNLWTDELASDTTQPATQATVWLSRLTPSQQELARALAYLERRQYAEAQDAFEAITDHDSSNFIAWYGLGESISTDDVVIADSRSPSTYAFRGNYARAIRAYDHALTTAPFAHVSYAGLAVAQLCKRYFTEPTALRWGQIVEASGDTTVFAAAATLANDTLAFIPRPAHEVLGGRWTSDRNVAANEIGRRHLRSVTASWVRRFPKSGSAWLTHAVALEMSGSLLGDTPLQGALPAVRQARLFSTGRNETLGIIVTQVRIHLKARQWRAAALLADSTLSRTIPTSPQENNWLAGLAGLIGRIDTAATYLAASARPTTFGTPEGRYVQVESSLASEGLRLLAYAASGSNDDSTVAIHRRLMERIAERPADSALLRPGLLDRPQLLAFPLLGAPEGLGSIRGIERAIARGDHGTAKGLLDTLTMRRRGLRPGDYSGEITLLEGRLRLAIGDTTGARALVSGYLSNLDTAGLRLLEEYPQAAALRPMFRLLARLGHGTPELSNDELDLQ